MSLYINKTNQEILWNTIQRLPLLHRIDNKELWFREIICFFHESKGDILDIQDLKQINRDTIKFMIDDLHNKHSSPTNSFVSSVDLNVSRLSDSTPPTNSFVKDSRVSRIGSVCDSTSPTNSLLQIEYMGKSMEKAKKQEQYNTAFEERQKQFNELFVKPSIPEVDFSEKLDDEPINNVEELIEKHRKEREEEIKQLIPPLTAPS